MKALIHETQHRLGATLERLLGEHFFTTERTDDRRHAERWPAVTSFDLVVAVHEPVNDARTYATALRERGVATPLLVVLGAEDPKLAAEMLAAGADDVLHRPLDADLFLAHVSALTRRRAIPAAEILSCGEVRLDLTSRRTYIGPEEVHLPRKEALLLEYFLANPGRVLSRSQIISKLWSFEDTPTANVVDVHVLRLRKNLGTTGRKLLKTVHGFGYRFGD